MANSVVKVTDIKDDQFEDKLLLLVGEDGTVAPDQDTVENYLKRKESPTNIQIMKINKSDKQCIDISVDNVTYMPDVISEEIVKTEVDMAEVSRNLYSFRLDHDYTPFTSSSFSDVEMTTSAQVESDMSISMSEPPPLIMTTSQKGKGTPKIKLIQSITISPAPNAPILKPEAQKQESTPEVEKEERPPTLEPMVETSQSEQPVLKTWKTKPPQPKSVKEKTKKKSTTDSEDEEEEEESYYDEEDFNFEIDDDEDDSDYDQEQKKKNRKSTKSESKWAPGTPRRTRTKSVEKEKKPRPETPSTSKKEKIQIPIPIPIAIAIANKSPEPKLPELKPEHKSSEQTEDRTSKSLEKKVAHAKRPKPKPMLDDLALFSTPDIIRRVGGGKALSSQSTPSPLTSGGEAAKMITRESRTKSIESEKGEKGDKSKLCEDVQSKPKLVVEQKRPNLRAAENILDSGEIPSAEDIRSIILNQDTKSFTTNSLSLDSDPTNINLVDGTGLDLDPTLLDNLNNDEISEDILYQVAQSLVSNPELQNAIDKGINEGVLPVAVDQDVLDERDVAVQESSQDASQKGIQIVRPNGKIVVIPPIERPTTRSRNKKKEVEKPPIPKFQTHKQLLDEDHVSGNEVDSSGGEEEEEEDDESEDDPNKLWCICNQPHNNRFMICCDTCEEWYHGKCVNITKAMGQQMEADGKEWICLFCKDPSLKRPLAAARRIRKASRNSRLSTESLNSSAAKKQAESSTVPCVVCQKQARKNSIYCSEACILSHAQAIERVVVFERATGKILTGTKAPSAANLEHWLKEHKGYEVLRSGGKVVTSKGGSFMQSKLKLVKNNDNNGVSLAVQKKGVNLGVMKHSPKQTQLQQQQQQLLKNTINATITGFKLTNKQLLLKEGPKTSKASEDQSVLSPKPRSVPATTPPLSAPNREKKLKTPPVVVRTPERIITMPLREKLIAIPKEKLPPKEKPSPVPREKILLPRPTPKSPKTPTPKKQENIRENVQKTVHEQLLNRLKECQDIKLSDEEVKDISVEIESQLFKCFGDTGQKYRNKYRSLIFNIKDAKNHTLWRRICEKSIGPYELVRLSPDDMASQELAKWRENEAKHSLDMIKKSELELLNCNRQYVLKTHKGEQVVEDERVDLTDNAEVIKSLTEGSTLDTMDPKADPKDPKKGGSKHGHKDRDRKSSREKDHRSHRSRSSSRESRRRGGGDHKKHSRDRDRDKHRKTSSYKSSRYKKDMISTTDKLDKKSKEILESLVDNKIVPPLEDKLWKHVSQDDIVPPEESDSDHEPTSTVTIPTPPRAAEEDVSAQIIETKTEHPSPENEKSSNETSERSTSPPPKTKPVEIWRGIINMVDVAQISITAHEVSGECGGLGKELSENLDIVGRISPDTVWDYIGKMKCSNSKGISLIRLKATNIEERMPYLALYSYLSSRDRLGVVRSTNKAVKDFYIYPLAPQKPIPQVLLPINGPGFEESRPALLLGIIVRDKRKARLYTDSGHASESYTKKIKSDTVSTIPAPSRSYTPPPMKIDPRLKISVLPIAPVPDEGDEPYSPGDSSPEATPPIMDQPTLVPPSLGSSIGGLVPAAPFSIPVTTILPSNTFEIQRQVEELNKRIEAEKSEITSMTKNIVSASTEIGSSALANIALPSNLQQILDSIKTIGETSSDPSPSTSTETVPQTDLTIPLMIPKTFVRPFNNPPQTLEIPLNLPNKLKGPGVIAEEKPSSVLGSLSEEELIRKAAEMLGEEEVKVKKNKDKEPPPSKRSKHEISLPPVPGLEPL